MKQNRETNVAITAEYPQFADPAILAQLVPELERGQFWDSLSQNLADAAIWPQPVAKLAS